LITNGTTVLKAGEYTGVTPGRFVNVPELQNAQPGRSARGKPRPFSDIIWRLHQAF
jgi:hypothetical protein